jgi:uncharacterized repeat protein (TIGR02543 family)
MKTTKKMFTFLMAMLMILSVFSMTSVASAASSAQDSVPPVQGPTVTADPDSPTGYTVTFVYYNPNATQVRLAGDLTLLDVSTGNTRYQPEAWQTGRYHAGGTEFLRDMTKDADGYWSVSIPLHAGGLSYWYRVWDPTQGWSNKRIWDPASTNPRPAGNTTFRVRNNDVLDAVYVPYDQKQNDPVLETRAIYELPIADPAQRGTVQYVPYTTILGDSGYYLGVYLPAGYDANRAEPYKVVYLAHGIFGDETDFMIPVNVPNILDNMIARGEIEPTVVVTMGNHFTGTSLSFSSYNQTNAANNLVQTILPLIEANYNVSNKREGRAYGGFSYGGMTGGIVIRTYPTTFGFYGHFSGNPSLTTAQYNTLATAVGTNVPFVFMGNGFFEGSLNAANNIANNFRTRGIPSETAQVPGAHDGMTAGQLFTIFARDYLWTIYTVEFDLNGGDSAPIDTATVYTGRKVVKPADPSREGYIFRGWYLGAEEFDFDTPITGDITLVARWIPILDNFNRPNGVLGSNWKGASSSYRIVGNRVDVRREGAIYWKDAFGVNQEAFVTLSAVDLAGGEQDLLLKVQGQYGPNWGEGVIEAFYDPSTNTVTVWTFRLDTLEWYSYTPIAVTFADGDQFGAQALSTGEVVILKNGMEVGSVTLTAADQAFFNPRGGYIGLWFINAGNAFFDDFGGGDIVVP